MTHEAAGPNREATEVWNTVLFDKFSRFRHVVTAGLATHGDRALASHPPPTDGRALDIGCGFGDTTLAIAKRVGARGAVTGIDVASRFIDGAQRDASEQGVANARFVVGDAQEAELGGPYNYAFSRFGTMFFADPVAAMRNVRRALRSDAVLVMAVWRKREANEWMHVSERVVRSIVGEPAKAEAAATCGPGPFSMASADATSDVLQGAGFREVTFERHDAPLLLGRTMDEAIDFALTLGPAGEIMRLAGDDAKKLEPRLAAALREAFAPLVTSDGVLGGSSAWIVSARA